MNRTFSIGPEDFLSDRPFCFALTMKLPDALMNLGFKGICA
jgi:hypothetical protein